MTFGLPTVLLKDSKLNKNRRDDLKKQLLNKQLNKYNHSKHFDLGEWVVGKFGPHEQSLDSI